MASGMHGGVFLRPLIADKLEVTVMHLSANMPG